LGSLITNVVSDDPLPPGHGSFRVNSTNASSMITSEFDEIFRKWSPNIRKRSCKISEWYL